MIATTAFQAPSPATTPGKVRSVHGAAAVYYIAAVGAGLTLAVSQPPDAGAVALPSDPGWPVSVTFGGTAIHQPVAVGFVGQAPHHPVDSARQRFAFHVGSPTKRPD